MRLFNLFLIALGGASLASAQATITELGPAASYIPTNAPAGGIAQGSYFYIKGTNLGPAAGVVFTATSANYTMGADLAGTRVRVGVGSTVLDAFPYYTSATQVNVILPSTTPVGNGTVTVFYNNAQAVFPIKVVRAAYGVFTLNSAGSGPAVVTNVNNAVVTLTNALHPGDTGVLWGTGLGPVNFADNQPTPGATPLGAGVTVVVGGQTVNPTYAGRTPGLSGLDQINFVVPQGVSGCGVPLVVRVGNVASNFVSIPVAPAGTNVCSDPGGLSPADLSAAAAANGASIGSITLTRTNLKLAVAGQSIDSKSDSVGAVFGRYDFNGLISSSEISGGVTNGACMVSIYRSQEQIEPGDPVQATILDAGPKLVLTGGGVTKDVLKNVGGAYSAEGSATVIPGLPGGIPGLPGATSGLFLEPGTYTVSGTGGAHIGPFSATITIPQPLTWTNQAAITAVSRTQDLRVTWTGGNSSDNVIILGGTFDTATSTGGSFVCFERASAGGFTIPSYVLNTLPPSTVVSGAGTGILSVGSYSNGVRFNASGLTYGILTNSVSNTSTVNYQ